MAKYSADIEIAVRGAKELTDVSKRIGQLSQQINIINKTAKLQGAIPSSINNYRAALNQANAAVNASVAGTRTQKQAIDLYVKSLAQAEKAERNLAVAIKQRQRELGIKPGGIGGRAGAGRLGGVASNAIIGGAFPLLFGQGGGAAAGGAIGGAVGGLFGGTGGFAGSLLGTLLGQLAGQANQVKELAADIGFTTQQTQLLGEAFKKAGADFDKFQDSVQNIRGLGLSIEDQADAIRLVTQLTETYGGKIDKVTNAFTNALETGKVTQATLNQLTSQGIPIQDQLAAKYGVSRDAILQMAKDGKISVQSLSDALVDMGNKGLQAGEKPKSAFEQFNVALGNTAAAVGNVATTLLGVLAPAIDTIILKATQALNILTETINTELLRTQIQSQTGKILSPEKLQSIEAEAMSMASRRYPSKPQGRQLAAGPNIISPQAQADFQIIREQLIRNELQRFGYESGVLKAPKPTIVGEIGQITAPSQLPPSGGGGGGGGKSDAERAAEKAAELEKQTQARLRSLTRETELIGQITNLRALQFQAELDGDKQLQIRLKNEEEIINIVQRTAQELDGVTDSRLQQAILSKAENEVIQVRQTTVNELTKLDKERQDILVELLESLDMEVTKLTAKTELERTAVELLEYENTLKQKGVTLTDQERQAIVGKIQARNAANQALLDEQFRQQEINNAVNQMGSIGMNVFDNLINRTNDWNDVLRDTLKNLGSVLMQLGLSLLGGNDGVGFFSILSGTFGKRASGGPVMGRKPYLVGERGPELFVPGSSGGVMSNSDLRSAMNSSGGSSSTPVFNMNFETTRFGDTEYVSRDQLEAAMAATRRAASRDGAQRGMTMTLDKIRQSPQTRNQLGIRR